MTLDVAIYTETLDTSYTNAEDYCADYYALRVDEVEEAVVADYVANSRRVDASEAVVDIDAVCSSNTTGTNTVSALFSIRFVAYASSLFTREDGTTIQDV